MNDGLVDPGVDVVVAPPSLFLQSVETSLRKDFKVSAQVRAPVLSIVKPMFNIVIAAESEPFWQWAAHWRGFGRDACGLGPQVLHCWPL